MRLKSAINHKIPTLAQPETNSRKFLVKLGRGTSFQQIRKKGLTLSQSLSRFQENTTQTQDTNGQCKLDQPYASKNIYNRIQMANTVRQKYSPYIFQQQNLLFSKNQGEIKKFANKKLEDSQKRQPIGISKDGLGNSTMPKRHSFSQHHMKTQIHFTYQSSNNKKNYQIKTRPETSYQSQMSYGQEIAKLPTKDQENNNACIFKKNLWKTKESLNSKDQSDDPYGLLSMKQKKIKESLSYTCLEAEFIENDLKCSLERRLEKEPLGKERQSKKSLWDAKKVTSIVSVPQKSQFSIQQSKVVHNFFDLSDFD